MKTIVIKGKIGSGKTTVSEMLENELKMPIFNCDKYVTNLYKNNNEVIKKVNILLMNQDLSRSVKKEELRELVYNDKDNLTKLENITYPLITAEIKRLQKENKILFLDCPTIEKLPINYTNEIFVQAKRDQIFTRIHERDQKSDKEIEFFLNRQKAIVPSDKSYIISNDGTLEQLKEKINEYVMKELVND